MSDNKDSQNEQDFNLSPEDQKKFEEAVQKFLNEVEGGPLPSNSPDDVYDIIRATMLKAARNNDPDIAEADKQMVTLARKVYDEHFHRKQPIFNFCLFIGALMFYLAECLEAVEEKKRMGLDPNKPFAEQGPSSELIN